MASEDKNVNAVLTNEVDAILFQYYHEARNRTINWKELLWENTQELSLEQEAEIDADYFRMILSSSELTDEQKDLALKRDFP